MGSQEVLRMLRSRWLLIVLVGLLGTAIGLAVATIRPLEYTAQADVFVTVTSGQSTGDLAQGSTFSQDQARNFAAIVPREIVLAPVIEELGLQTTLADLRKNVEADVPLNTSLITIKATDHDPVVAASIANSIASHLSEAVKSLTPTVSDVKGAPVRADTIESASVPEKPSAPIVPLFALLGLLAGLVLAIGYLVVVELMVAKVNSVEDLEAITHTSVLASVPRDRKVGKHPIAVTALPLSLRAENIRQVRTALKFLPGTANHVFALTSSISGEGKSTTSANIAAAFAAEGNSTCLVEADLRRPRLEGLLDLTGGPGLSDIIVGQSRIEDTLQTWGPDNLQVILAGTVPPNASELLGSPRGQEALAAITARFDVTIVDTPPLTAVTDAAIIGRKFGGVVMVVGGGRVHANELRQAMATLSVADVPIRGVVFNLAKGAATHPYAYSYSERARERSSLAAMLPQGWRPVIRAAVAIVATVAVTAATILLSTHPTPAQAGTIPAAPTATATATTTTTKKTAAFIGDSLVQGTEGGSLATGVAGQLGWKSVNLGRGGTGYVTSAGKSGCGLAYCPPFPMMAADAAAAAPDVVVVSGGENDGDADVSAAASMLFTQLRTSLPKARIIVVAPLWRASVYPESMVTIRAQVKSAAKAAGVTYVDIGNPLQDRPELITSDGVHPTKQGYALLSKTIANAIEKL
jgi:capsular exopolysaccharide synthesis family protein